MSNGSGLHRATRFTHGPRVRPPRRAPHLTVYHYRVEPRRWLYHLHETSRRAPLPPSVPFPPRSLVGCMLHGPVHRQQGHQWYDPLGHVLGVKYPLRAMGSAYVMSGRMAREVVAARGDALRVSHNGTCSPEGVCGS